MRAIMPPSIRPPLARYSHAMEVPPGLRWVVASGQLGVAPDGTVPADAAGQAALAFANIDAILAEAGMTRANVVRINTYLTDRAHAAGYMAARDAWIGEAATPPASTMLIVSGFSRPEFVVEIEVMAAG